MRTSIRQLLRPRGLGKSRAGSVAVELGLLLPMLAGMVIPLVDLGMGAYAKMQLQNAVQAGAGFALINGFNPSNITAVVNTNGASLSALAVAPPTQRCGCATTGDTVVYSGAQSPPTCGSTCPNSGIGKVGVYVTVSATANYTPLFNYPGLSNPVNLSAQSIVRIQ
jgi:Flp pilus assembly protein TadG